MSARHTPGPWVVCVQDGEDDAYTVFAKSQLTDGRIADGKWDDAVALAGLNHENHEANARLIAAAPELLAALRDCALVMQYDLQGLALIQPELRGALAAIAKATGRVA